MKKKLCLTLIAVVALTAGCSLFKETILIDAVVNEKARMDGVENPAMKYMIRDNLGNKKVHLIDLTVKEIIESANIDYSFCVVADVQTKKGLVQCNIYSTDVKTISSLVKGKTKIDATGDFGRFFSILDDYYTRLDIVKASITIK